MRKVLLVAVGTLMLASAAVASPGRHLDGDGGGGCTIGTSGTWPNGVFWYCAAGPNGVPQVYTYP